MDDDVKELQKPAAKRKLTQREETAITRLKQKGVALSGVILRASETGNGTLDLAFDQSLERTDAIDVLNSRILETTGTVNSTLGIHTLTNAGKAIIPANASGKEVADQLDKIAQSMRALAPQDEYEGQLVAQLVVLHEHAMEWLGRAVRTDRVNFANVYLNGASKLLTRHHETLETLLKYRRKGEQRVHVEHVHIHGGGQAIVGNVTSGGGMNQKVGEGPHAKV